MKRTFQKGNRLWSIETTGKRVTTTWGIAGGKMQSKSDGYAHGRDATLRLLDHAALKLRAGYVETTFRGDLPLSDLTARGLLEALAENPDDLAAHMAFADWLSEQSDGRLTAWGEFIRLQLAQERPATGNRKSPDAKRLEELRDGYELHWLGEALAVPLLGMGGNDQPVLTPWLRHYARGWLDSLTVFEMSKSLARAMGKAAALKLLRTLILSTDAEDGALKVLAKSSVLGNVRHLGVVAHLPDAGLNGLVRSMPRLKSLRLAIDGLEPGALFAMPSLASLDTLEVVGPIDYHVHRLAANPALANLHRLALNTVTGLAGAFEDESFEDESGLLGDEEVHTICYSPRLKGLKELVLHGVLIGFVGCHALADSGILARLDLLDLTRSNLDDNLAGILASSPEFALVPRVILDENFLSRSMVRRLRLINKGVQAKKNQGDRPVEDVFDDERE